MSVLDGEETWIRGIGLNEHGLAEWQRIHSYLSIRKSD
jgi:hypothetical protein